MFNRNYRAWDGHNKVMKYYTFKQLVNEDRFNYDTEVEPIDQILISGFGCREAIGKIEQIQRYTKVIYVSY